jgi:hypothetical protein
VSFATVVAFVVLFYEVETVALADELTVTLAVTLADVIFVELAWAMTVALAF